MQKLWSSVKDHKTPFLFELEHEIVLYAMPGCQASSRGKGKVSWFFSRCLGNLGYNLVCWWGWPFKSRVCSATYRLLSTCEGQLGILLEACECNTVPCQGELGAQGPFLPPTGILGFLSIFKSSQPSSNFEAFISPLLSRY